MYMQAEVSVNWFREIFWFACKHVTADTVHWNEMENHIRPSAACQTLFLDFKTRQKTSHKLGVILKLKTCNFLWFTNFKCKKSSWILVTCDFKLCQKIHDNKIAYVCVMSPNHVAFEIALTFSPVSAWRPSLTLANDPSPSFLPIR